MVVIATCTHYFEQDQADLPDFHKIRLLNLFLITKLVILVFFCDVIPVGILIRLSGKYLDFSHRKSANVNFITNEVTLEKHKNIPPRLGPMF